VREVVPLPWITDVETATDQFKRAAPTATPQMAMVTASAPMSGARHHQADQ
jgi:hypothetical protein